MRLLVTGGSGFIGTNLLAEAKARGAEVANLDLAEPLDARQRASWSACDILDERGLAAHCEAFAPTHVVHLAARTDTTTDDPLEAYPQNTRGTENLLAAVRRLAQVEHVLTTSSQFVCRPGYVPSHAEDYDPHTIYGQSKVITEQLTRDARLDCRFTIIRPTTIWGPWCMRYLEGFFPALRRGLYVHPGREVCVRSYGYVGNVVDQILAIFAAPPETVASQTLYVGDAPGPLIDWVDGFARELTGRPARVAPRPVVRLMAGLGDVLGGLRRREFPINSSRLRSMTEDYVADMKPTFDVLGEPPFGVAEGIRATARWLEAYERGDLD